MTAPFAAALDAIEVFIRSVLPRAEMTRVGNELRVKNGTKTVGLTFTNEQLDDFEVVLGGDQPVGYSHGLRDDLYFPIYVALGMEGMIPNTPILAVLLNQENRDWLTRGYLSETRFTDEVGRALYEGLIELQSSLRLTLESAVEVPEVEAELRIVETLTKYYERVGTLDSTGVSVESLSYLKAAALCWIQRLQVDKARTASRRAKLAYEKKIYEIVRAFWVARPYNRIKLPAAIHDYIAQQNDAAPAQPVPRPHVDIGPVLAKLDVRLRDRWRGAWAALQSDNPDRVSQAANSMVEVLNQVIDRVRGPKEFKDYLADRFPEQTEVVLATRTWISRIKDSLHGVKHHTAEQSPQVAEDLMHQAEWVINLLLR
jgi:hypothetical protein